MTEDASEDDERSNETGFMAVPRYDARELVQICKQCHSKVLPIFMFPLCLVKKNVSWFLLRSKNDPEISKVLPIFFSLDLRKSSDSVELFSL